MYCLSVFQRGVLFESVREEFCMSVLERHAVQVYEKDGEICCLGLLERYCLGY